MNAVHKRYWEAFNRLAADKLSKNGFSFDILPGKPTFTELFQIRLTKGVHEYLLSFSSHHLDYQDGVTVEKDGQFMLPPTQSGNNQNVGYGYNDKDVIQLVDDLCRLS